MALDPANALLDVTGSYINQRFQEQSWFKENANFVTSAAGLLTTIVAWAGTQEFASDPRIATAILILGFIATTLGVKKTKNGISKSQAEAFATAQAHYQAAQPLRYDAQPAETDLEAEIAQFNEGRAG